MNPAFRSPILRARSLPLVAILAITTPQLDAFAYEADVKPSSASGSTNKPAPPAVAIDRPASTDGGTAVQVRNVRLEADPVAGASPASTLKFEMLNDGS